MKKEWYCYICGKKLLKSYFLCSMANSTDRVFLICKNKYCIEQIDEKETIIIEVRETN